MFVRLSQKESLARAVLYTVRRRLGKHSGIEKGGIIEDVQKLDTQGFAFVSKFMLPISIVDRLQSLQNGPWIFLTRDAGFPAVFLVGPFLVATLFELLAAAAWTRIVAADPDVPQDRLVVKHLVA